MDIQIEMLPTDERDKALGKYMDAFSRLESILNHLVQTLLGTDWRAASVLSSVLYSQQNIKLIEALAAVRLPQALAKRVAKECARLSKRNMRRNHIVHGGWQQYVTVYDDHYDSQWIRIYKPSDPTLAAIQNLDNPKLLGMFSFTIPSLEKATGHVEEMFETLSPLLTEIRELLPPPPIPSEVPETPEPGHS